MNDEISALDLELATLMKEHGANDQDAVDAPSQARAKAPQGKGFVPEAPQGEILNQLADDQKPQRTERERQLDAALREERAKRKDQERQRRALEDRDRQRQANFETLLARMGSAQAAPQPSAKADPAAPANSVEELEYISLDHIQADPVAALAAIADGYNMLLHERKVMAHMQRQQAAAAAQHEHIRREQGAQIAAFMEDMNDIEADFTLDVPDYPLACEYAVEARRRQLVAQFPAATEAQIADHLQREMLGAAWEAKAQGRDPAEATYRVALALGYDPEAARKAMTAEKAPPEPKKKSSDSAANAAGADPLRHIREGQKAAKSAGAGGGQAPPADTDLDALLDLDGEAFLKSVDSFVSKQRTSR